MLRSESRRDPAPATSEIARTAVTRLVADYLAAWNAHEVKRVVSLFAADGSYAEFGGGSVLFGREEIDRHLSAVVCAVPDLTMALTAAPDFSSECVLLKWTIEGTQHGEFAGVPGNGRLFKIQGSTALFLRGEEILRALDCFDVGQLEVRTAKRDGTLRYFPTSKDVAGQDTSIDSDTTEDNIGWGE